MMYIIQVLVLVLVVLVVKLVFWFYSQILEEEDTNRANNIKIMRTLIEGKYNRPISLRTVKEIDKVILDVLLQQLSDSKFDIGSLKNYDLSVLHYFPAVFDVYKGASKSEINDQYIEFIELQAANWSENVGELYEISTLFE